MKNKNNRYCGILMHPVSFPGPFGIGCLGWEGKEILNKFAEAKINLWQILPLGPTGYGDSPYASHSSFAGNELLIDLRSIDCAVYGELSTIDFQNSSRIDYGKVKKAKMKALFDTADAFLENSMKWDLEEYENFCKKESWWLNSYALFHSLSDFYNDSRWYLWPEEIAKYNKKAIEKAEIDNQEAINRYKVLQFFFDKQWNDYHKFANSLGISIVGDVPIFVASDSVDVWTNRKLFKLDKQGRQTKKSGVPPDSFSSDGQLWGNPVYDWEAHKKTDFHWWKQRVDETLKKVDILRIDHFRGFEACWEVDASEKTARKGEWVKGPGYSLIKLFKDKPIIAEDLGVITEEVKTLKDASGFPGMKILQFGFGFKNGKLDTTNSFLPHNYEKDCVCYTGTHDNNTSRGWYNNLSEEMKDIVRRYLQSSDDDIVWQMIRSLISSSANYAVFPIQDLIGLGSEARMNMPSTMGQSNWSWRCQEGQIQPWMLDRLSSYIEIYGRSNESQKE
ncbi:MAG: 4-alpha-glucanotransferase [Sphaerochaetaceae bacterium]